MEVVDLLEKIVLLVTEQVLKLFANVFLLIQV